MKKCLGCSSFLDDGAEVCSNCGSNQFVAPTQEELDYIAQYYAQQNAAQNQQYETTQQPQQENKKKAKIKGNNSADGGKSNKKLIPVIAALGVVLVIGLVVLLFGNRASKGLEFVSNGDGTCYWSGIGTCTDTVIIVPEKNGDETVVAVGSEDNVLGYSGTVTKVVLPKTIVSIGEFAFSSAESLEEIELNEGLKTINDHAFSECSNLKSVVFPTTLESIGQSSFWGCTSITEVVLPEGLITLENFAFNDCTNLKKVSLPSTITNEVSFSKECPDICPESLEEINLTDNWKYYYLDVTYYPDIHEEPDIRFHILTDKSYVDYPGSYYDLTDNNRTALFCTATHKTAMKINGEDLTWGEQQIKGKYIMTDMYGFVVQEFVENNGLNVDYIPMFYSYEEDLSKYEKIVCSTYQYDETNNYYTFTGTGSFKGADITINKIFYYLGDFIVSYEEYIQGDKKDSGVYEFIRYQDSLAYWLDDGVDIDSVDTEKLEELEEKKNNLLDELAREFRNAGVDVTINETTGELALDSSVLFGGDSSEITAEGKSFIDKFIGVYSKVVFSEKYDGLVSKTVVEGHTAPVKGTSYEADIPLSEARAKNVLDCCIASENSTNPTKIKETFESVGYSNSKPVYDNSGAVDMDASRRVSFRLVLNLE